MLTFSEDNKPYYEADGETRPITDPTELGYALQELLENEDIEVWIVRKTDFNEVSHTAESVTKLHTAKTTFEYFGIDDN